MPKFSVKIYEVWSQYIEVEADDEKSAIDIVGDMLCTGSIDDDVNATDIKYDYTLDTDEWKVTQIE